VLSKKLSRSVGHHTGWSVRSKLELEISSCSELLSDSARNDIDIPGTTATITATKQITATAQHQM